MKTESSWVDVRLRHDDATSPLVGIDELDDAAEFAPPSKGA
jgi:hypothetical protein